MRHFQTLTGVYADMGLLALNKADFDLANTVREVLRMFDAETSTKGVAVNLDIDSSIAAYNCRWIHADANRLSQVMMNCRLTRSGSSRRRPRLIARLQSCKMRFATQPTRKPGQ